MDISIEDKFNFGGNMMLCLKCKRPINVQGLRLFLYCLLDLIKEQNYEKTTFINDHLASGISTILYKKYKTVFDKLSFNTDNLEAIDKYYQDLLGVADCK